MLFFFKPMVYVRHVVLVQSLHALMSRSLQYKTLVLPSSGRHMAEKWPARSHTCSLLEEMCEKHMLNLQRKNALTIKKKVLVFKEFYRVHCEQTEEKKIVRVPALMKPIIKKTKKKKRKIQLTLEQGLNCMGPLIHGVFFFFSFNTYSSTRSSTVG